MRPLVSLLFFASVLAISAPVSVYASDFNTRVISFFFPDTPEMVEVARCESGLRHTDASGSVLRGGLGGQMVGLFQLYEKYHRAPAQTMGYDIDTLIGNVAYTRSLHRTEGLTPWNSSRFCWQKEDPRTIRTLAQTHTAEESTEGSASAVASNSVTEEVHKETNEGVVTTLRYGAKGDEVVRLQELLTRAGYTSEMTSAVRGVFDIPTYRALIRFQCENGIACLRGGPTEGLGTTNQATRNALALTAHT